MEQNNRTPPALASAVEQALSKQQKKAQQQSEQKNKKQEKKKIIKNVVKQQEEKTLTQELSLIDNKEKIKTALIKKALGYTHKEIVEEYVCDQDGEVKLSKRKVTKKFSPPDIPAVKILLDEFEQSQNYSNMTEQELEQEKMQLLKQLKQL